MSKAPAAAAAPAEGTPPKKSKKMLFIIVAAVLVLGIGGAGTFVIMGKRHGGEKDGKPEAKKVEKKPSVFAALDPFTVNLADRDRDHYLQIGLTYEVSGKDVEEAADAKKDGVGEFGPDRERPLLLDVLPHAD